LNNPNKKITSLEELMNNPDKYFINIDDSNSIMNIYDRLDLEYLEGAIIIKYNHKNLMDFKLYDLIDQLWSYLLNIIEDYYDEGIAETYFPDQPVKIILKKSTNNNLIFTVDNYEWNLKEYDFLDNLLNGAEQFFKKMNTYSKHYNEYYNDELNRINKLKKLIST
jgi:hypothetical protein